MLGDVDTNGMLIPQNGSSLEDKAEQAWHLWCDSSRINQISTQFETYNLMKEAFIDGYLKGFVQRISGD